MKEHKTMASAAGALIFVFLFCSGACGQTTPSSGSKAAGSWVLAWSDEFNGPDGTAPDPTKWSLEIGGNGWGNNELEYYTDRPQNAHLENGNLVITARQENYT